LEDVSYNLDAQLRKSLAISLIPLPINLLGVFSQLSQAYYHRGIDIAATGSHYESFKGGHAHGCIFNAAVVNGGHAATVAQMTGDKFQLFKRCVKHFSGCERYECVR